MSQRILCLVAFPSSDSQGNIGNEEEGGGEMLPLGPLEDLPIEETDVATTGSHSRPCWFWADLDISFPVPSIRGNIFNIRRNLARTNTLPSRFLPDWAAQMQQDTFVVLLNGPADFEFGAVHKDYHRASTPHVCFG